MTELEAAVYPLAEGTIKMPGENKAFDFPLAKPDPKNAPLLRPSKPPVDKLVMVLDMGEASREEGFRLNGCR